MTINYKTRDIWSRLLSDDSKDRLLKVTVLLLAAILCKSFTDRFNSLTKPCLQSIDSIFLSSLLCPPVWVCDPWVRPVFQLPNDSFSDRRGVLQFPQLVWRQSMVPSWSYHWWHYISGSYGYVCPLISWPPIHKHSDWYQKRLCISCATFLQFHHNYHLFVDERVEWWRVWSDGRSHDIDSSGIYIAISGRFLR